MDGLLTKTGILSPKSRTVEDGTYTYEAIAKTPNTKLTDPYWAISRTKKTNGDTDYPKNAAGVNTDEFVFTATRLDSLISLDFSE